MAPYLPSALGATEVPLDQMVSAYSAFPNKGIRVEPHMIRKVVDRDGAVMEEWEKTTYKVVSEYVALTMVSMMREWYRAVLHPPRKFLVCPWPERPARSTITPTFGSWATRRHTSLESGWVIPGERSARQ